MISMAEVKHLRFLLWCQSCFSQCVILPGRKSDQDGPACTFYTLNRTENIWMLFNRSINRYYTAAATTIGYRQPWFEFQFKLASGSTNAWNSYSMRVNSISFGLYDRFLFKHIDLIINLTCHLSSLSYWIRRLL